MVCISLLNEGKRQANKLGSAAVGSWNVPECFFEYEYTLGESRRDDSVVMYRFRTWQLKGNAKLLVYDRLFLSCANMSNFKSGSPPFHGQWQICWLAQGWMVNYVRTWILSHVCPTPMLVGFHEIIFIIEERGGEFFLEGAFRIEMTFSSEGYRDS